jgi:PKD repeat protein
VNPSLESYVFVAKWGSPGAGDGQFVNPLGVAVDPSGNVYVSDPPNNRIQKFSSSGTFLAKWGTNGTGDGQFSAPCGVAVDPSGNIYVAEWGNSRIQKFSSTGTFLGKWGSYGTGDGQFYEPNGIAVDSLGNVYVAEVGNNRIQKFSSTGTFLAKWGSSGTGDGQFYGPYGVATDSSGNVYVADSWNHRIQKFSSSGTFISKWGAFGAGDGQFRQVFHVTTDPLGNVYVTDQGNYRVQKFSSTGTFLAKMGSFGTGDGQFQWLCGVAVDSSGNIYAADNGNSRIQKFAPSSANHPVANFTGTPTSGSAPMNVQFNDTSSGSPTGWAWFFGDETYSQAWTRQTASAGWAARSYPSSVVMPDGSIVLMGGCASGNYKNDVWRSTDNGTTWTQQTASAGWSARRFHTSISMPDGSIVLMGGIDNSVRKNDVWRSIDKGSTWTQQTASAGWSARAAHSSVAMPDGSIVFMGGDDNSGYKNDVWRSTDNGATWTQMNASAGWSGSDGHSSVVMPDGSIVLMGGWNGSGQYNDTWRSTDNGATWTRVNASAGWSARATHSSVVMPDGSIVLMGGYGNGAYKNDVWRSIDNGATWMQLPNAGWSARDGHGSVVMPDGSIVLIGGEWLNDVWRFVPTGSSAQNPSHTYITPGTYSVSLTVSNAAGSNTLRKSNYITVNNALTPDIIWQKCFGGLRNETISTIVPCADGGYLLVGSSTSQDTNITGNHGGTDMVAIKVTSSGTIEWQKSYGGSGEDSDGSWWSETSRSAQQTTDGGYILAGYTNSLNGDVTENHGGIDVWVVKINGAGGIQWQKTFGGSADDWGNGILQTSDGGYIFIGGTTSNDGNVQGNHGSGDIWVGKLSSTGTLVWQKCYGGTNWDRGESLVETAGSTYTLTGYVYSSDGDVSGNHGSDDMWVARISANGILERQQCFGGLSNDWSAEIRNTNDGGVIVVGGTRSHDGNVTDNHGSVDMFAVKLSQTWTLEWQKSVGGTNGEMGYGVFQNHNGEYVLVGEVWPLITSDSGTQGILTDASKPQQMIYPTGSGRSQQIEEAPSMDSSLSAPMVTQSIDVIVATLAGNGATNWQKIMGGSNDDLGSSGVQAADGGLFVVGQTQSNDGDVSGNHGGADMWMVKLSGEPASNTLSFQPGSASVSVGSTTTYKIVLDTALQGLSGYNITLVSSNATIAEIVSVTYPAWTSMPKNSTLPADRAWFKAVDLDGTSGTQNITFFTVTVRGDAGGSTTLSIIPEKVEDRAGGRYTPSVVSATLTVTTVKPFPKPGGGFFPDPTDPNHDGKYEDIDGNGWIGFNDVVVLYQNMEAADAGTYGPVACYDYDSSGFIGFNDVVKLYGMT